MSNNAGYTVKLITQLGNLAVGSGSAGGLAFTSVVLQNLFAKMVWIKYRRNGNATPETMRHDARPLPRMHHLLDPTTVASQFSLVWENMVQGAIAVGACTVFAGAGGYTTAGDFTTMMGIGFYAGVDNKWHAFCIDSATGVAPYTSLLDVDTGILMTDPHRLKFIVRGPTKTIDWYIDGVLQATFTPVAALRYMGTTGSIDMALMTGAFVPANGDVTVRTYAGPFPLVRMQVASTPAVPAVPAVASGGGFYVSVF